MPGIFEHDFIAPIRNIKCSFQAVSLPGKYTIRKINSHEEDYLRWLREKRHFMPPGDNEYVLVVPVEQEIEIEFGGEEARRNDEKGANAIEDGIKLMRLFQGGLIGFDCILGSLSDSSTPGYRAFYSARYLTRITGEYRVYDLADQNTINSLTKFWETYLNLIQEDNRALHWFYKSYHEFYGDDRLLDLVIALESLFLKGDSEKQSLRYKLAIRSAFHLAESEPERKETFDFITKVYKLRNKITHGDKVPDYDAPNILPQLEDIVRKALAKTLVNPDYHKHLDDNILR